MNTNFLHWVFQSFFLRYENCQKKVSFKFEGEHERVEGSILNYTYVKIKVNGKKYN